MKEHADYNTEAQLTAEIAELKAHPEKLREQSDERAEYYNAPEREAETAEKVERMRIVEELYRLRKDAGLTQTELARRIGTRQTYIAALEKGRKNLTFSTLYRYALACGKRLKLEMV